MLVSPNQFQAPEQHSQLQQPPLHCCLLAPGFTGCYIKSWPAQQRHSSNKNSPIMKCFVSLNRAIKYFIITTYFYRSEFSLQPRCAWLSLKPMPSIAPTVTFPLPPTITAPIMHLDMLDPSQELHTNRYTDFTREKLRLILRSSLELLPMSMMAQCQDL